MFYLREGEKTLIGQINVKVLHVLELNSNENAFLALGPLETGELTTADRKVRGLAIDKNLVKGTYASEFASTIFLGFLEISFKF